MYMLGVYLAVRVDSEFCQLLKISQNVDFTDVLCHLLVYRYNNYLVNVDIHRLTKKL